MRPMKPYQRQCQSSLLAILIAGAAVLLSSGCGTLRPTRTAVGVPDQHQLVAGPFLIFTRFPLTQSDPLVQELLALRSQVHSSLQLPESSRLIEIYIFDGRPAYDRFIRANYPELPRRRAFFLAQGGREVVYAFRDERLEEDLRHEACHALLHAAVGAVPLWLDEGLAEYFETPGDADGLHPRHAGELQAAIQQGWRPALTRLESLNQLRQMTSRDYREAWGWVYFMLKASPQGREVLLGYLQDLRAGTIREPLSARLFQRSSRPDVALVTYLSRLESVIPATADAVAAGP
jgi:hypothetical protein